MTKRPGPSHGNFKSGVIFLVNGCLFKNQCIASSSKGRICSQSAVATDSLVGSRINLSSRSRRRFSARAIFAAAKCALV